MSGFDYARTQGTASRLISKFGQSVTFRRPTSETGDAWNPTQTTTDYPAEAAMMAYETSEIDGTMIQIGDRKLYVATFDVEPLPGDRIIAGGVTLSVISVKPLSPAGTVVFFEVQARV